MAKNPAYPMYAQDFDMDTASWSVTAIGAYIRLMNYSWINGPLPDDTEALARIARMDHGNFRKVWCPLVISKWTKTEHGLVNSRMEIEREKRAKFIDHQRSKGKKSGEARMNRGSTVVQPELQPEGNLSFSSSLGSNEPSINTLVRSPASDPEKDIIIGAENNGCPHQEIIKLYHEILPALPQVRVWTPKRQKMLKARWLSSKEYQDLEWWKQFFVFVRDDCPHLTGKNDRQWTADLEWLCKEENFVKTVEGRYHKK
jgi:uncharacterized protein YdaU (DUF1376 family)